MEFVILCNITELRVLTFFGADRDAIREMTSIKKISESRRIGNNIHHLSEAMFKIENLRCGGIKVKVIIQHTLMAVDRGAGLHFLLGPQETHVQNCKCYTLYIATSVY